MPSSDGPNTLTPIGVRIPVESMSMRALIGIVQAPCRPGVATLVSSSAIKLSCVRPGRHCSRGFNCTTVSNIDSGAGSKALSARPALPNTRATSGTLRICASCHCKSRRAVSMGMDGTEIGMYSRSPSYSGGMNSEPRRDNGHHVAPVSRIAPRITR